MVPVKGIANAVLWVIKWLHSLIPKRKGCIPTPNVFIHVLLNLTFGNEKLYKLEFLTDFYRKQGLFRYDQKVYIFEPKLTQTAINKLEKGAEEYLKNSPLKDTFLGQSSRSPEVRRHIAAIFRKSVLEEKAGSIIKDAQHMCDEMEREANKGSPVNVTDWVLRMAMDVVGHMLLQLDLRALEGTQEQMLRCLMTILHRCYALSEISADSAEFVEANATFEKLTSQVLADALEKDDKEAGNRLVVKLHEACGFDQARDNMKLFLMAGSETTAATVPVMFSLLTTYPDVQEELRQEADENFDALLRDPAMPMPKIEAVLTELLRTYAIAPFISRRTYDSMVTIGDVTLKPHTDIIAFTWGIHRSESNWTDAKEFKPFRFLASRERTASSTYIPFGAGSRICIGQHLAWLELKISIAVMLHRFRFISVPQTPDLKFAVDWAHAVIHPDKDMYFKLEVLNSLH